MTSVFKNRGKYVVKYKDGGGEWRFKRTEYVTKAAAEALAKDLHEKGRRQALGLEPFETEVHDSEFSELLRWWKENHATRLRSKTTVQFAEKHLGKGLSGMTLREVTPAFVEKFLSSKEGQLKAKSINSLRQMLHQLFKIAVKIGMWTGPNPIDQVEKRKAQKRLPEFLTFEEASLLLKALDEHWRPIFATAIYTGMRKGELLGLRREDVHLDERTITVCRSYGNDSTKGGHADVIPIADDLLPFLRTALDRSTSSLVFPKPDGTMYTNDLGLAEMLRAALIRAGIAKHYEVSCSAKNCTYKATVASPPKSGCARCSAKLESVAVSRHVRFHDLRHTTATLLLKTGVPAATVQRVLRHRDARLTLQTYGHLDMEDMKSGVNSLDLGLSGPRRVDSLPKPTDEVIKIPKVQNFGAPLVPNGALVSSSISENSELSNVLRGLLHRTGT